MSEFFSSYKFSVIGAFLGLLFAVFFLTVGFFKTILLLIIIFAGAVLGIYLQKNHFFTGLFSGKN